MINLIALSYKVPEYVEKSLKSIINNASEEICMTIVDNKSKNSNKIFEIVKPYVDSGKVKRYVQLQNNVQIMAFNQMYIKYPPDYTENFFMFTELDLVVKDFDWISETRKMMQDGHVLSGFRLSLENYKPPNGGHQDDGISCGFWLMALNRKIFDSKIPLQASLTDHRVREVMKQYGTMKQNPNCLYHLAWDLHIDDPEYFTQKVALGKGRQKWNMYNRSVIEFVYEKSQDSSSDPLL